MEWLYPELVIVNTQMKSTPIRTASSLMELMDSGRDGVVLEILNSGQRSRQTDHLLLNFYTPQRGKIELDDFRLSAFLLLCLPLSFAYYIIYLVFCF